MATEEFKLPELGESVQLGKVITVLVNVGETIAVDQPVLEVETDKALIEVPSSVEGRITEIRLEPGDEVEVGATILLVEGENKGSPEPAASEIKEARKATAETSPEATNEAQETGSAVVESPPPPSIDVPEPAAAASEVSPPKNGDLPAAPTVRRIAREAGIDLRDVPGSGPGGRISTQDVMEFVTAGGRTTMADAHAPEQLPDLARWGEIERVSMSGIRRATSTNLGRAWRVIPHVTQCEKADISDLDRFRRKFAQKAEDAGGKLTVTAILLKVVASALKVFPHFNASVDAAGNEIVHKSRVHVGVAVDTENGLLVPVIRDADQKSIIDLAAELNEAAERARTRKLAPDDMEGGSITITNLGGFGGTYFTPIVKWPEVAIVGVSRARIEPVWSGTEFEPRLMLPLMVSYDHRVIDGAEGIKFLRWVADALEEPMLLNLEG